MKILYCSWYENSREDLERALNKAADEVIVIEHRVKEYLGLNENIRQEIIKLAISEFNEKRLKSTKTFKKRLFGILEARNV